MKYCISSRQQKSVLAMADEIKVRSADVEVLIDFIAEYPTKTIIYEVDDTFISSDNAQKYQGLKNLVFEIKDLQEASFYSEAGYKWYWKYPVTTWFELNNLIALNPAYITLGTPLTFDLERVAAKTTIPLRMYAFGESDRYLPVTSGIYTTWVRPEDIHWYEKFITTIEIISDNLTQDATRLRIYKNDRTWPGNIKILIPTIGIDLDNRMVPPEFAYTRMTCGQRCMSNGTCHYCENALKFAVAMRNNYYK